MVRYVLMLFQAIFVFEPAICGCVLNKDETNHYLVVEVTQCWCVLYHISVI